MVINSVNQELSFDDLDQMIGEMEQRNEFKCTANDGRTCPSGACAVFGEVCAVNLP